MMDESHDRLAAIILSNTREMDLAEAALLVAQRALPRLRVSHYLARMDGYVETIQARLPCHPHLGDRLFAMNTFLFDEMGFSLQTESQREPPGFFHRLLDTGEGDATSLLILYLEVGRKLGMRLEGLSFSGHPLARVSEGGNQFVLDPLSGGLTLMEHQLETLLQRVSGRGWQTTLSLEKLLPVSDDREILIRILRTQKAYYLQQLAFDQALWTIDTILNISPAATMELRDRAAIYVTLGFTHAAVTDYCHYLDQQPDATDVAEIRRSLRELLDQRITWH